MSSVFIILGLVIALAGIAVVSLWVLTRGDYMVPATVTDDPSD